MKSKKFVLAGLVLLAITMVLLPLSGCKNDSVPETPETPKSRVTFDVGVNSEATAPEPITVESGTKLTADQVKPLADTDTYSFVGWFDQTKKRVSAGDEITGDVTLTAFWVLNKWLSFTCDDETHLEVHFMGEADVPEGMEYSTDGSIWTPITKSQREISFGRGTNLYLRAKSSVGTEIPKNESLYGVDFVQFAFRDGTRVQAAGDIRTLVDWENPTEVATSNARFGKLFMDCDELVTAPELPAETLADFCYASMFSGCTGLTQAPELPAETLADFCYASMFSGCTGLTEAPELLAKTLASECYQHMFYGCENLSSVTMLATDVNVFYALDKWLDGTKEGGTLYVANEEMTTDPTITGSLPTGWTVEVAATN